MTAMTAMTADYDLTDALISTVEQRPGLSLAKLAKKLRADVGTVRQTMAYLTREHYVTLVRQGGKDTYHPAA